MENESSPNSSQAEITSVPYQNRTAEPKTSCAVCYSPVRDCVKLQETEEVGTAAYGYRARNCEVL